MTKILVGCPTSDYHDYCLKEYSKIIKSLSYKNFDILLVDNSKNNNYLNKIKSLNIPVIKGKWFESAMKRIITSRNILRQKVLDDGYDYLFSLEQDVIPPKDAIQRLLSHDKKIVSGIYFNSKLRNGKLKFTPLVYGNYDEKKNLMRYFNTEFILSHHGLLKIAACGLGCVLIHRSILEQIKFRYEKDVECFDDMYFCTDARNKGFKMFADTSVKCKHMLKGRKWIWKDLKF